MIPGPTRDASAYRVTFFFGPEAVEEKTDALVCVFNVKKRSWKAGIQVAVEIGNDQLSALHHTIKLGDRLAKSLLTVDPLELPNYHDRIAEVFAQAVCWYKLDLRLLAGLTQENQRILADEMMVELDQAVSRCSDHLVSYILEELDLISTQS